MAEQSLRSPDRRWLVDRVTGAPAVAYRPWDEGQLAAECATYAELQDVLGAYLILGTKGSMNAWNAASSSLASSVSAWWHSAMGGQAAAWSVFSHWA